MCITHVKYTFILDRTAFGAHFDSIDSFRVTNNDLGSLFGAWDDTISDMPTDSNGGSSLTESLGTPSTESIFDSPYCQQIVSQPGTTLPPQCTQGISYRDTQWDNETDADDALYNVILPNPPSSSSDKSSNVGIIAGVVVGACVVFVVMLLALRYFKRTKKCCFVPRENSRQVIEGGCTSPSPDSTAGPESVSTVSNYKGVPNQTMSPLHGGSALPLPVMACGVGTSPTNLRPTPQVWKLFLDPNSGKVYYYNEQTLTSSWDHPDEIKSVSSSW